MRAATSHKRRFESFLCMNTTTYTYSDKNMWTSNHVKQIRMQCMGLLIGVTRPVKRIVNISHISSNLFVHLFSNLAYSHDTATGFVHWEQFAYRVDVHVVELTSLICSSAWWSFCRTCEATRWTSACTHDDYLTVIICESRVKFAHDLAAAWAMLLNSPTIEPKNVQTNTTDWYHTLSPLQRVW